jgi:hypothetical protein
MDMALDGSANGQSGSMLEIAQLTGEVKKIADGKIDAIRAITGNLRMLALNAMIESARAGDGGRGFAIVAQEVKAVSLEVDKVASSLEAELAGRIASLETMTWAMSHRANGERLVDLALNAIEIIDRNLYERSCDVRWWATDPAIVECAIKNDENTAAYAGERLAVILGAYTVYLDIWLCSLDGKVLTSGRSANYAAVGTDVSREPWFERAKRLSSGDEYSVSDITTSSVLGNAPVATYAASVREGGKAHGRPVGVLAIHFDWGPQAKAVVDGVRLSQADKARSRALIVDMNGLVLASSDGAGVLSERVTLGRSGEISGYLQRQNGEVAAFHRTPGYETYRGQGWFGVILQKPA